ncbi:hypothetical protein G9A89_013967 [Geosiphon pyriformis]|nr:hypothetical protein G9A89_013967 [Geosiphon pyriformis]
MHTDLLARHFGKTKTIQKTLARYYWPTLEKNIAEYIKTCDICQKRGKPNHKEDIHPISYWIKNYSNTTLTIGKQTTITDNNRTHTVIRPKKTTTRRKKISSKMDKYLLESITAAILPPSNTIGKTLQEILLIDKNLLYRRQLELYGHLGEIIENMKLIKKTTSEIQAEILGIIQLDVPRVLTIAKKAKTLIQKFGLLDTKLISPQVLYTITGWSNKLIDSKGEQYCMMIEINKEGITIRE